MPEMPQYTWFVPVRDDPVPAEDDLDDAASLAAMPPPDASQRTRIQKRGWAHLHSEVTKRRRDTGRAPDDELATRTGDESLVMSTRSNTASAWNAEEIVELEKCSWPEQDHLHSAGMGMVYHYKDQWGDDAAALASSLGVSSVTVPSEEAEGLLDINMEVDEWGDLAGWDTST